MKLTTVDHVSISVANIVESVNWYQTSFECEVLLQEPGLAVLRFQNVKLILTLPSHERPHVAFERNDADSFGALKEMRDGSIGTYISDPTGNIVELVKQINPN